MIYKSECKGNLRKNSKNTPLKVHFFETGINNYYEKHLYHIAATA